LIQKGLAEQLRRFSPMDDGYYKGELSCLFRIKNGACRKINTKVIGTAPNTLKFTQKLSEKFRHIISLIIDIRKK
jgi:hypothetical protein